MEKQNIFRRIATAIRGEKRSSQNTGFVKLNMTDRCFVLNGLTNSMFNVPEIRNAINFVAEVFSTIPMYHRRTDAEGNTEYLSSTTDFVINKMPNILQTKTTFWITVITELLLYNNAAIVPHWNGTVLDSLEPLPYLTWQLEERNGNYIILTNGNGTYPIEDVILLSRFCSLNGGTKNQAIGLHQSIMQAIQRRAEQNAINPKVIQAYLKIKQGNMKPEAAKVRAKEIAEQISSGATEANGFVLPYVQGDVDLEKIDISAIPVDTELLTEVTEIVYNYFGLTKAIIQRKASELDNEMFLTTTIKPLANQVSEEFSKKLFTRRELQMGNWIELDLTALQVATLDAITRYAQVALRSGLNNRNELRERVGYGRIPGDDGDKFMVSRDLIDIDIANEFFMKQAKSGLDIGTATPTATNLNIEENNNENR